MGNVHNKNLLDAVKADNVKGVLEAISNGANPNIKVGDSRVIIWFCIHHPDKLKDFLEVGGKNVNLDKQNKTGETALMKAIYLNPKICQMINTTIDTQLKDAKRITFHPDPDIIPMLIAAGADVNIQTKDGNTALMIAVRIYPDIVPMLIAAGADVNIQIKDGNTALMIAAQQRPNVIPMLLTAGAKLHQRNNDGATALFRSVCFGEDDALLHILNAGGDPNDCNNDGYSALIAAVILKSDKIIPILLRAGANVNQQPIMDQTALMYSVFTNRKVLPLLLDAGADITPHDNLGNTALSLADEICPELIPTIRQRNNLYFLRCCLGYFIRDELLWLMVAYS